MTQSIKDNVAGIEKRVSVACAELGRSRDEVTIVAVVKHQPVHMIAEAVNLGLTNIAENYVAEAVTKQAEITKLRDGVDERINWHLIGHLQRNKVRTAVSLFDLIQSVDSEKLLIEIDREAARIGKNQKILIQPKLGEEASKSGVTLNGLDSLIHIALSLDSVKLMGIMGIPPNGEDPTPHFQTLDQYFRKLPSDCQKFLSMGMSEDFENAISQGATMVRIGTSLFGRR